MKDRNDLEGSVNEIIQLFSWDLPERTEGNREESVTIANVPVKIPNEHLLPVSVDHTVSLETKAYVSLMQHGSLFRYIHFNIILPSTSRSICVKFSNGNVRISVRSVVDPALHHHTARASGPHSA
jgi:hypothetical protein